MLYNTFNCDICGKKYKHQPSLSRHKNTKHAPNDTKIAPNDTKIAPNDTKIAPNDTKIAPNDTKMHQNNIIKCCYCDNIFSRKSSLTRHINLNRCKVKIKQDEMKENIEFKKIKEQMKDDIMEILKKECKMHPKTLQKINKQLQQQNNSGNINNGTINNNNNVIYNIVQLGDENLSEVLSKKEQIKILNQKHQSLNYMTEYIHFNKKFPQFRNIAITNLKDNLAHTYDKNKNKFIVLKKDELLNNVIEMRMLDIEDFYNNHQDDLDFRIKTNIKKFINKMANDDKYYNYKKSDIKLMLYNNTEPDLIKEIT
jgi:uncharacterized C2H2 Zn-finger protein